MTTKPEASATAQGAQHTPTPWKSATSGANMRENYSQPFAVFQGEANLVAGVFGDVRGGQGAARANAEFIVRAVNSHAELLMALVELVDAAKRLGFECENANRVISKATEGRV